MKYIFGLSLSGICLALSVFVLQGNAINSEIDFSSLLDQTSDAKSIVASNETTAEPEKPAQKTREIKAQSKQKTTSNKKSSISRNEAIKGALKGRTWEEAKPDVVKILGTSSTKEKELKRESKPPNNKANEAYKSRAPRNKQSGTISEEEAVAIALKDTPGEMIGVKWKKGNYRVKVWSEANGATYKIYIDPQSGQVVRRKRK